MHKRILLLAVLSFSYLLINSAFASCLPSIVSREGLPFSACEKKSTGCVRSKLAPELYVVPEGISRPHVEASGTWGDGRESHFYGRVIQPIFTNRIDGTGAVNTGFFQGSHHWRANNFQTTNLGMVYRHMPRSCRYILGVNAFIDKTRPINHRRFSFGGDLETYTSRFYFNVYMPMNDWKVIDDAGHYIERPLSGWELAASKRFENIPSIELIGKYYRFDRRCGSDVHGIEGKVEFTPYPIVTGKAGFKSRTIDGDKNDYYAGCQLNYHFGIPFKEQVSRKTELRPIPKRIHDKVRRIDEVWTERKNQLANPGQCDIPILAIQLQSLSPFTFTIGSTINFIMTFKEGTGVFVTGTPRLNFTIVEGGGATVTRSVPVQSVGNDVVQFAPYVTVPGDPFGSVTVTGISIDTSTGSFGATNCVVLPNAPFTGNPGRFFQRFAS